jgi:hypothetical protein
LFLFFLLLSIAFLFIIKYIFLLLFLAPFRRRVLVFGWVVGALPWDDFQTDDDDGR